MVIFGVLMKEQQTENVESPNLGNNHGVRSVL